MPTPAVTAVGKVFLIGAGPGDPGLITWRGVECLRRADVVLYDYLVNPAILRHTRADAELQSLGRHRGERLWTQTEINDRMVEMAKRGLNIARLKGGDPIIFGRLAEEIDALVSGGVPYEIVPGVTAALAAGSYAGICVTHREQASAVALITGHEQEGKTAPELDYEALARFPGTLVFYMGVTTAPQWATRLIESGKPPNTPAAIVRRCTWPDQQVISTTLADVANELAAAKMRPPAIVIIGDVAAAPADWFATRPLFGQRVLVTRPLGQTAGLEGPLTELGAMCMIQPAIEICPPANWLAVDAMLDRLSEFDWLVFSSANGVRFLLDRLLSTGGDLRRLGKSRLAAIGPGTSEELARYHLRADVQPDEYRAESLAAALKGDAQGRRFLLVRANRGREVLAEELTAAGGAVEQVVVYESRDVTAADEQVVSALSEGRIDWITVTSSAIAHSLARMFGDSLRRAKLASISPITSGTLRELGFEPAVDANPYTMPALVAALVAAENST